MVHFNFVLPGFISPLLLNNKHFQKGTMANVGPATMRQAARLCTKNSSSAGLLRSSPAPRALAASAQRFAGRRYISESKNDSAQINVESAIKADQKKFAAEAAGQQPLQATTAAEGVMDPMAGMSYSCRFRHISNGNRRFEEGNCYGSGRKANLPGHAVHHSS